MVVVASLIQHRSSLALGNAIGSSISNILGAFSLGLLFHPGPMEFDQSARIYTSVLFGLTTVFTAVGLVRQLGRAVGGILIATFVVYVLSIGYAIYQGIVEPPVESDSESEDDDDSTIREGPENMEEDSASENSPLVPATEMAQKSKKRSLQYHIAQLILGFLALSLSGYILSHSASNIASAFSLSGTVVGMTILSLATTLPEKFIAVLSGARGHSGIVVANTAGSNIFLLTLCLGITLLAGNPREMADALLPFELLVTWASSASFFLVAWLGGNKVVGGLLLGAYLVFLVLEFTVYRR